MRETNINAQTFETFFNQWLIHQERYLQDLLCAVECKNRGDQGNEQHCKELIDQITAHYGEYYEAKAKIVKENVFLVLTPAWFSSFEKSFLWVGGFRPGLAFWVIFNNVLDLTDDQSERINTLMREIKQEERLITDEFDTAPQGMVSPQMVEIAGHMGMLQDGAKNKIDLAADGLKSAMEALVECADFLRKKTGVTLLEILKPTQAVRFLAAAAQLQLRLRMWGMQRETLNLRQNVGAVSDG